MDQWERNTKMSAIKNNPKLIQKLRSRGETFLLLMGCGMLPASSQPSSSCPALRKQVATRNKV